MRKSTYLKYIIIYPHGKILILLYYVKHVFNLCTIFRYKWTMVQYHNICNLKILLYYNIVIKHQGRF